MPIIWRKFTNPDANGNYWRQIKGIWRKFTVPDAQGNYWRPVTFVWRRNTAGVWSQVYLGDDNLSRPESGFTFTSDHPSGDFYSGSTLTLRRGTWTNDPTEYRMRIQYGLSENQTDGTSAGPVTYTPANSTASTTLTYTLTAFDCLDPSYYYKGTISVDNAAGTNTVTNSNQRRGKINIDFSFSSDLTPITANGGTARWTADVIGNLQSLGNDAYIDRINIIVENQSGTIVKQWQHRPDGGSVQSGYTSFTPTKPTGTTFTYVFSDPAITSAGGQHKITIQVYAKDTDRTLYTDYWFFTPLSPKPVNVTIPTIDDTTPTIGDTLTASPGTWSGASPFTYQYQWQSSLNLSTWTNISGATSQTFYLGANSSLEGFYLRVRVIAEDTQDQLSDPSFSAATSAVAAYTPNPPRNLSYTLNDVYINFQWDKPTADPVWGSPSEYWLYLNNSYEKTVAASDNTMYSSFGPLSAGTYSISVYAIYGDIFSSYAISSPATITNIVIVPLPSRTATAFVYSGTFQEGQTVSVAASGSTYWNNVDAQTTYLYEWGYFSDNFGEDLFFQSSASNSFTIPSNYADSTDNTLDRLRVKVTATNSAGSASSYGAYQTVAQGVTLYTVFFNANNGSGSPSVNSVEQSTEGGSVTLATVGTLSRTGYTFRGWNTNSSGTGTTYSAGGSFTPTSNTTLYALWQRSLSYDANGGTGAPATTYHNNNATATISSTAPTRTNFTFNGWNTSSDGTGTNYSAGGTITMSSSIILYARWTAVVARPSDGTISISGTGVSGTVITVTTANWTNSPTSYNVRIFSDTISPVLTSDTLRASNSPNTSTTASYTVTLANGTNQLYFRGFATATNSGGTSTTEVASSEIRASRLARPTSLSLSYTGFINGAHRWKATWTGSVGATSYAAYREVSPTRDPFTVANTSTPQTGITTLEPGTTNTFTTNFSTTTNNPWARFYVKAVNDLDDSGYAGPSNIA